MGLDPEIPYWLEMAEALAYRDIARAAMERPHDPLGTHLAEHGGGVSVALTVIDEPFFNRTLGMGVGGPATEEDVAAVSDFYRDLGRQWATVQIAEHAQPTDLIPWFEARGFARGRRWPKLWRALDELPALPATGMRIEIIDSAEADAFASVVMAAFEFSPELAPLAAAPVGRTAWTHYIGFEGDVPVSAAAMFITDDVAWLGFGSTLASHRGRGGQSAMFGRRLQDARAAGCRLAITETGEDTPEAPNASYRNMLRLGFEVAYLRSNWVRRPEAT